MDKVIGDIRTLDRTDIEDYIETVDLADEERKEVMERFTVLKPTIQGPVDNPIPVIVNAWL